MATRRNAEDLKTSSAELSRQANDSLVMRTDNETPLQPELSLPETVHILSQATPDMFMSSGLNLPQLSPDTTERVFPIRSVVSLDSSPSSTQPSPSLETPEEGPFSPFADGPLASLGYTFNADGSWNNIANPSMEGLNTATVPPEPDISTDGWVWRGNGDKPMPAITRKSSKPGFYLSGVVPIDDSLNDQRSTCGSSPGEIPNKSKQYQITPEKNENTPHRGGNSTVSQALQKEKLLTPDAIQNFGALIALQESQGRLAVQVASDNTKDIIAYTPEELFMLNSFYDILSQDERAHLKDYVDFLANEKLEHERNGPDVLSLSITTPSGMAQKFWCTMHAADRDRRLIVLELELDQGPRGPLGSKPDQQSQISIAGDEKDGPATKMLTSDNHTPDHSLKVLREFRKSKRQSDHTRILRTMSQLQQLMSDTQTLSTLLNRVIDVLKELSGFDQVIIYQIDDEQTAGIVVESTDRELTQETYRAPPVPEPVLAELRTVHLQSKVYTSYNNPESTARLIYREPEDGRVPLNMTSCYLSATSPCHVKYLADNGVGSSMSMSIHAFGDLWGLIVCQTRHANLRVQPIVQKMCWLLSDMISNNIERLSCVSPLPIRQGVNVSSETDSRRYNTASAGDILSLFGADYAASSISGETKILGKPSDSQEVLILMEYLKMKEVDTALWSTNIGKDFQDLSYPPGFKFISGLLYVPLSAGGHDFIIFCKANRSDGNNQPGITSKEDEKEYGGFRISPDLERKTISSGQAGWSELDLENASILSLIYKTFNETWKQREAVMQSTQLMRLLLANSAHEFRTPLNAIINYLEIALDGSLDQEIREVLSRSHSASKSLVYIINDLLDLTNAENGQSLIKDEVFDLSQTIHEATDIFGAEAEQKNVGLHVVQHSKLPPVLGDQRRVRQVITNLISNALQHTSSGAVTVESSVVPGQCEPGTIGVEVAIHDTGSGMPQETVEALFCELEQVSNQGNIQQSQHCRHDSCETTTDAKSVLGLGLALVARIVYNMDGQLSVKSEEDKGSCFKIKLKFPLPTNERNQDDAQDSTPLASMSSSTPVQLVDKENNAPKKNRDGHEGEDGELEERNVEQEKPESDNSSCGSQDTIRGNGPKSSRSSFEVSVNSGVSLSVSSGEEYIPQKPSPNMRSFLESNIETTHANSYKKLLCASDVKEEETPLTPLPSPNTQAQPDSKLDDVQSKTVGETASQTNAQASSRPQLRRTDSNLHVLVAEDDPVNSTILRKRLEKFGHTVHMTGNGKECASVYREHSDAFDAVLMDLQMPIVDGLSSTKMIRESEQSVTPKSSSTEISANARIPIFAVSASLMEKDRQLYIDSGFDGWIMKPIDFHRVNHLLMGVQEHEARNNSVYKPGMWENGGWFEKPKQS